MHSSGSGYQFPKEFQIATPAHQEAEAQAAEFFSSESALYLAAGYYFGLVTIATLQETCSAIFFDAWAHYSLREAIAASGMPSFQFCHLDTTDLELQLKRRLGASGRPLIVTDGLYATFGEIAPVDSLANLALEYNGRLLVDESHGFGVLGHSGRGAYEHHNVPLSSLLVGGSTAKALGAVGGIIPASAAEVAAFRATRVGRGASSGLPAAAAMCARAMQYVRAHPELLQRLRANVVYMKAGLRALGLEIADTAAPVATFATGNDCDMQALQKRLMTEGIYVFHTTYMGAGDAGVIRCGIFADHTQVHFDRLFEALRKLL